ncbi:hypothetical protein OHV05_37560 (plasmid) [Kitasatospora sp. NBC_00070]|uniref:hypothetical protein n=1 Tax=Kitasatospora sp. NBC_00070 TaxID=2975962 RepID=UPI002F9180AE
MTPEERFLVEELEPDKDGRPGWGLRDQVTGDLVLAGGETDRYGTPDTARMHIQSHWYHAQRLAVAAHIEQFVADAAHRREGQLGPRPDRRPRAEPPEAIWVRGATTWRESA